MKERLLKIRRWFVKLPVPVRVSLIGGVFLVSVALIAQIPVLAGVPKLQGEILTLKEEVRRRDVEILNLNALLTPLRTIGLEKYTGSQEEAMRKLSDYIITLQKRDAEQATELRKLKDQAEPRGISESQKQILIDSLKNSEKGVIGIMKTSLVDETGKFCVKLSEVLRKAGFTVGGINTNMVTYSFNQKVSLVLMSGDIEHQPIYTTDVINALSKAGLQVNFWVPVPESDSVKKGELVIYVADKE